ncbi:hypothetical protein GCM10011376_29250 [Nocardioides flavus (ex Wang et al. 2016)]|uniref:Uncharacterized protein n=1 Tax=Nocardioides flavus (ex Wang et al. 2016) TaxID=2058780 RepID=A0ABQ3HR20_9ACTN|nr:hypothetical protein GCM10011376_29250 [Nocardioides flavus (ex Wang et al. 2016)]
MGVHMIEVTGQTAMGVEGHQGFRTELADLHHERVHGFVERHIAPPGTARSRLRDLRVGVSEHPRLTRTEDPQRICQLGCSWRVRSPRGGDDGSPRTCSGMSSQDAARGQ